MGHLKDTIHIDAPAEQVVGFSHRPDNWASFMVGMSDLENLTGDGTLGTEFDFSMVEAGVRLRYHARVAEDTREADGRAHSRFDFNGASSGWQTWDFAPEKGGCLVAVEMEYTVPGSLLGKVADRLVLEKMQERDIHHSLENLKSLNEGSLH